ncbi:hypothetical protein [Streptomyces sp. NPDC001315]|uniref:hypothetical protein n=1 Tax=Streptomyces sp. NPDC001315 TaxID=3364562 RepID=UPI0036CF4CE4
MAEAETPRPQAGELLVRVAVSSVNGFDAATAAGYLLAQSTCSVAVVFLSKKVRKPPRTWLCAVRIRWSTGAPYGMLHA